LVESFRNEQGKPRYRTICTLGRLEAGGEVDTLIASLQRVRGIAPAAGGALDGLRFTGSLFYRCINGISRADKRRRESSELS
jgi:hypothetical protein